MKIKSKMVGDCYRLPQFAIDFPKCGFEVIEFLDYDDFVILEITTGSPDYSYEFSKEAKQCIVDAGYVVIE